MLRGQIELAGLVQFCYSMDAVLIHIIFVTVATSVEELVHRLMVLSQGIEAKLATVAKMESN